MLLNPLIKQGEQFHITQPEAILPIYLSTNDLVMQLAILRLMTLL